MASVQHSVTLHHLSCPKYRQADLWVFLCHAVIGQGMAQRRSKAMMLLPCHRGTQAVHPLHIGVLHTLHTHLRLCPLPQAHCPAPAASPSRSRSRPGSAPARAGHASPCVPGPGQAGRRQCCAVLHWHACERPWHQVPQETPRDLQPQCHGESVVAAAGSLSGAWPHSSQVSWTWPEACVLCPPGLASPAWTATRRPPPPMGGRG